MKKAPNLVKGVGAFLFRVVFDSEMYAVFSLWAAFQTPALFSEWGSAIERKEVMGYSICFSSGWIAKTSASLANRRGYFGLITMRVSSFPMPNFIR